MWPRLSPNLCDTQDGAQPLSRQARSCTMLGTQLSVTGKDLLGHGSPPCNLALLQGDILSGRLSQLALLGVVPP